MKIKVIFKKIYKKFLYSIFFLIYGKVKYLKKSIKKVKVKKINYINNINLKRFNYKIFEIEEGRVFTNYVECLGIICENFLIKEISFQQINGVLQKSKNEILKTGTPKILKKFKGQMLSLTQGASGHSNYSHWLLDIIPKLKIFSEKYNTKEIDYFYFSKLNSFQKQSLKELKLDPKRFLDSNKFRHVQATKVFAVTHPNYFYGDIFDAHSNLPSWIVLYLRKIFLKKKFLSSKKYNNIFIDRSDSTQSHCKLINNKKIIDFLRKKKFKILKLSELSFKDQVSIFYNCKNIIAPHGAGLANLVFCRKNTNIIEIIPKNHKNKVYETISKINKLKYKMIKCNHIRKNINGDMFLSIELLKKYMR